MTTEKTKTALPGTAAESDAATPAQKPATEPATITTAQRRTESDAAETRESAETYTIARESGKTASTSGTTSGPTTTAEAGTSTATVPTTDRRQKSSTGSTATASPTRGTNTPKPRPSKSHADTGATTARSTARTFFPQPQGQPPLPRGVRLRAEPRHPRPRTPPAAGQALVRVGTAHGALARTASRLGVALRADQRPGAPRTPVSGPESERFPAYSFHPNDNRATVVVSRSEFLRYLAAVGNTYEFIELY